MRISDWSSDVCSSDLPASGISKTYHVKVDRAADERLIATLQLPVEDKGERLSAASARLLRTNGRSSWIDVVLTEGRNRQVRRMLAACGSNVLRLVRVAIGGVRSEEHTSELQSLMRTSYAVFCSKKKKHLISYERR